MEYHNLRSDVRNAKRKLSRRDEQIANLIAKHDASQVDSVYWKECTELCIEYPSIAANWHATKYKHNVRQAAFRPINAAKNGAWVVPTAPQIVRDRMTQLGLV